MVLYTVLGRWVSNLIEICFPCTIANFYIYTIGHPWWWRSELERSPRMRNPSATDLSPQTGSDSSTAKHSAIGHRRCSTLKNPHCSMGMSADHRSNFAAPHPN